MKPSVAEKFFEKNTNRSVKESFNPVKQAKE